MPLLSLTLLFAPALATVPDMYGEGPAAIGMGNAVTAIADNPFAAFYNPAGLGQISHPTLSVSEIYGQVDLRGFNDIVYDTNADGKLTDADGNPDSGEVGADYNMRSGEGPDPFYVQGSQVGAAFPILDQWLRDQNNAVLKNLRVTLGIAAYLPSSSTLRMQMQDPYMPYYVMYRNRNDRFALHPGLGVHLFRGVYLGAGAQMMFKTVINVRVSATTTADSFPSEDDPDTEDVQVVVETQVEDMVLDLQPAFSPTFGFLFRPNELLMRDGKVGSVLDHTAFGLSYRHSWKMNTSADVLAVANGEVTFDDQTILLSSLLEEPVHIQLEDMVALFNPPVLSLGVRSGFDIGPNKQGSVDFSADALLTQWSQFTETTAPYSEMQVNAVAGTSVNVLVGSDYGDPNFKDTWTLRLGGQWNRCWTRCDPSDLESNKAGFGTTVRAGYSFVPSPVPDQVGLTNYMDSDRNVYTAGLGFQVMNRGVGPIRFDVGAQYHQLNTRTVYKDDNLLADADGDGNIDYTRGTPLSGSITSAGNSWAVNAGLEVYFGASPRAISKRGARTE